MKILLILPDAGIHKLRVGPFGCSFREAPLTLTTLAALVPPDIDAAVRVVDGSVDRVPGDAAADLVGISCLTGTAPAAYRWADHYRRRGIPVVLGGVHVSLLPDEAARHADTIVTGFAEQTWPALLRDHAAGRRRPRYDAADVCLEGLPHPRRDLQRRTGYVMPQAVFATRGCRGQCDFCTVPALPFGWHTRPVAEVIDELRALRGRRLAFNDVSIAEDPDYARELFTAMIPLRKEWGGLITTRAAADPALVSLMARSGCRYLLMGFESMATASLRGIRKGFNRVAEYRSLVGNLHAHGISVQGCFIFGLDEDRRSVFDETVAAVDELGIDIPRYAVYTPYPGTRAFARLDAEGRLLHRDWHRYDTQHVVFRPRHMSPVELAAGLRRAYRETFRFRPAVRRSAASPRPLISLVGNLAYRRYARRLAVGPRRDADAAPGGGLEPVTVPG